MRGVRMYIGVCCGGVWGRLNLFFWGLKRGYKNKIKYAWRSLGTYTNIHTYTWRLIRGKISGFYMLFCTLLVYVCILCTYYKRETVFFDLLRLWRCTLERLKMAMYIRTPTGLNLSDLKWSRMELI
jgi:hypothetical protein